MSMPITKRTSSPDTAYLSARLGLETKQQPARHMAFRCRGSTGVFVKDPEKGGGLGRGRNGSEADLMLDKGWMPEPATPKRRANRTRGQADDRVGRSVLFCHLARLARGRLGPLPEVFGIFAQPRLAAERLMMR